MDENRTIKQKIFENKMAIVSSVIALLTVIVSAVSLIPQFRNAFPKDGTMATIDKNMSGKKVQSIIQDIVDEYFDDSWVRITEGDNIKYIDISIYAYRSEAIKAKKAVLMAESLFGVASGNDAGIGCISISFLGADSTVEIVNFDRPIYVPVIILTILSTTTSEGEPIWISTKILKRDYSNAEIFNYEYSNSDIFKSIDMENYEIENTNFSDDLQKSLK